MPVASPAPLSRSLYLATLALLQLALTLEVAPPLARTFKAHALFASLHDGWTVAAHLGGLALAVSGAALAMQFPLLALARHAKRGPIRYRGLPRWAVHVATAGAAIFVTALVATSIGSLVPTDTRSAVAPLAQCAASAGTAMMAAGALCAEMLRRSIAPLAVASAPWRCVPARLQALDPIDAAHAG